MSRQILREQAREETKMQKWFNSFTPSQVRFHKELVRKIVQDSQEKTELILDSCYIGAILEHTEIELSECIEIAKLANQNMEETSQYLNREREYYTMIEDVKVRNKIREAAKKMQIEGIKIAPGIKELRKTYDFPQKDIHIIWAEGREELKIDNKKEEFMEQAAVNNEKILNKNVEIEEQADKELKEAINKHLPKEEIPYAVTEKEIEKERTITIEEAATLEVVNAEFKAPTTLKIKAIEVEGKYGVYIKDAQGVKIGAKVYKDIIEVEEEKNAVERRIDEKKEELRKQIEKLSKELGDILVNTKKETDRFVEIEQVFAM